jgi:hypothetical protein
MYGTEVLLHKMFLEPSCRAMSPEGADLFFIPSYFKCISVINYVDKFSAENEESFNLLKSTRQYVDTFPWFKKKKGMDHVWLFSWGRHPCLIKNWRNMVGENSIR